MSTSPSATCEQCLERFIKRQGSAIERWLVGFSGGRDSHVLLDILYQLHNSGKLHAQLSAIHVDHGLHPQSNQWARHCQTICDNYQIPLTIETVKKQPVPGESIEAFARQARYRLIEQHLTATTVFLSAHHQRDQAETFLLQLMRGAGPDGLRAMPVVRRLGAGQYLRPLLNVNYDDIVDYAEQHHLFFIEDDSNDDQRFDRNYLRHQVLPVLERRFANAAHRIALSAKWLAELPDMPAPAALSVEDLNALSEAEQKRHIRAFVKAKIGHSLSQAQTQYILAHHLNAQADKHPTLTIGDYVMRRHAGELCLTAQLPPPPENIEQLISVGQKHSLSPVATLTWTAGQGIVCHRPLMLRSLSGSERFHPQTRNKATTVKKCLHEAHIPMWLRPFYIGLYMNDTLIAIPGVGISKPHYQQDPKAYLPQLDIAPEFRKL
ncbi:MAG: tRNA lysidine(34) synthetase TilS [Gammaproteobacteria bacterium]|nr:MAG: tRNA lysidine(34) synthetase TilS [Gammaproteobacteria bacterium]